MLALSHGIYPNIYITTQVLEDIPRCAFIKHFVVCDVCMQVHIDIHRIDSAFA